MSLSNILRLVPGGDDEAAEGWPPAGAAEESKSWHEQGSGEPVTTLVAPLSGTQMTEMQRAVDMFRVGWRRLRYGLGELWGADGGPAHVVRHGKAPSLQEQCEYARNRNWVPAGHEGGFLERAGVLFHALIGRPGVALGLWVAGTCARPFRFLAQFVLAYIVATALAWNFAGRTVALWMIGGLLGLAALLYVVVQAPAWIAESRQSRPAQMADRKSEEDEK